MSIISEKVSNPTKFYRHPREVTEDSSLTNSEKIKLLINWRDDEKLKSTATNENMPSPYNADTDLLGSIEKLLAHYQTTSN